MEIIYFLFGLITGIIIIRIYLSYVKYNNQSKLNIESRVFQLVESSKDIIYYFEVKPAFKHRYISPSADYYLGEGVLDKVYSNSNFTFDLFHPDDIDIVTKKLSGNVDYSKGIVQRIRDKEGNYKWFEEYITPIYESGELVAVQGIMRNIDDKMKLQQELEHRIIHDTLTDIYNRYFFDRNMDKYNEEIDTSVAIFLCDLDELKYMNDFHGHKKGDLLIQECAQLLKHYFIENAIVSRIGGDEFAIIIINTDEAQVKSLCEKLNEEISQYNIHSSHIKLNISIGYAFSEQSLGKMESIFIEAEKNMYQHKRLKKDQNLIMPVDNDVTYSDKF